MLPCVCSVIDHRGRQNVVRTSVTHSAAPRVPLFCSYHILTSSVIYYWTDARQHGIYLLNLQRIDLMWKSRSVYRWKFLNKFKERKKCQNEQGNRFRYNAFSILSCETLVNSNPWCNRSTEMMSQNKLDPFSCIVVYEPKSAQLPWFVRVRAKPFFAIVKFIYAK